MGRAPSRLMSAVDQIGAGAESVGAPVERTWARRLRWLVRRLPSASGAISVAIGTAVLAGWLLGRLAWTTVLPGLPAMTANSALMAILAGASLIACAPANVSRRRSVLSKLLAGAVAVIAALSLVEYLSGLDLGIDRLLADPAAFQLHRNFGRPSPQTSAAFLLIAASIICIDWRTARGKRPAEVLALLSGIIPLVALLGYVFGVAELYRVFALYPFTGMGVASMTSLLMLSVGTMLARADVGVLSVLMAEDNGGLVARQLVAWLLVLAVVTFAIEVGVRIGVYSPPIGAAMSVLFGTVAGSAFVLRVSLRLSRIDAQRSAAQAELHESRERFELSLRGADLAAWDWNVKSGDVVFSPRWAEMRGYRPDELAPRMESWISGVHPDDRRVVEKALNDYLQGRAPEYEAEYRARTKSGDWIWILGRGKVFERDAQDRPVRMVGTEFDNTARKLLEEKLRLAEERSSGILSISADAIISIDDRQRITSFNEGAENIFGYSSNEVVGEDIEMLIPERLRGVHRRHVDEFLAGPNASRRMGERGVTILGLRKNREEFAADASISKLEVHGTRILTVALHDITDQQRRESEKALFAQVGAILTSSLEYETTLPRVAELAAQNLADFCIVDLVTDDVRQRLTAASHDSAHAWICDVLMKEPLDRARDRRMPPGLTREPSVVANVRPQELAPSANDEIHRRMLDAIGLTHVASIPLLAPDSVLGAIVLVRSAASKPFQPWEVRVGTQLAERVALSVENGRLYRAAQRAIQARDELMGVVAHDLRNPLGTIIMGTSALRTLGSDGDGTSNQTTEVIERAAERMNRLIQDLLDVTRMEAGRLSMTRERVDTLGLLSEAVQAQMPLASSKSLELRLDAPEALAEVRADRDRLLQVFENLIGNAVKFTEPGGHITVGAEPHDGAVMFRVSDTGRGIDPQDLPHLFDRFWQAPATKREGAGLGLPIAKGIVEAHGGRIWVESKPLQGTTFYFTIPVAAARRPPPAPVRRPRAGRG